MTQEVITDRYHVLWRRIWVAQVLSRETPERADEASRHPDLQGRLHAAAGRSLLPNLSGAGAVELAGLSRTGLPIRASV
jgi:hypothetical protein